MLLTWSDRGVDGPMPAHQARRPASDRGPVLRLLDETPRRDGYHRALVLTVPGGLARAHALAEDMKRKGLDLKKADYDEILEYLATHFKETPARQK